MKTERTNTSRHDPFYVAEDHFTEPKEYFKDALRRIAPHMTTTTPTVLDIGCAAGDFLRLCAREYQTARLGGLDAFEENTREAQRRLPKGEFIVADMNGQPGSMPPRQFDVVTMLGVHSIFSSENWISNFAGFLKPGGFGLIFGMVNPYPYDVFVDLRKSGSTTSEYGWNSWSFSTIERRLASERCSSEVEYWFIPIDVKPRPDNPLRAWTVALADGHRMQVNGSRVVHDFAFISVRKAA
jgi:cyclopropane fatty-acyl-phospholipid synthase-like methyltransferase